jgi:hypothetical protein
MRRLTIPRLWPFKADASSQQAAAGTTGLPPPERGKEMSALEALLRGATPGTRLQLDEIFVGPRIVAKEHEWYYGARCRSCHRTAAALHDPNDGQIRVSFSGRGALHFHCHHCNSLLKATVAQILWFEFEG